MSARKKLAYRMDVAKRGISGSKDINVSAEHGEYCQIRSNTVRNSLRGMPDWVSIVGKVEPLILR